MKLKVKFSTMTTHDQYFGYALKAEVVEAEGIPAGIFVYHAGVPSLPAKDVTDTFSHVASPVDMEELPEEHPDMHNKTPFYRRSNAVLWVRSSEWLEQLKNHLDQDIALLARDYGYLNDENNYTVEETKTYG